MTMANLRLSVRKGASADIPILVETDTLSFSAISGMEKVAPLRVTSTGHGIIDGWRAAVVDAKGMTELNAADSSSVRDSELHRVTVVDANTIEFDGISAANFKTYTGSGYLAFYAPKDLSDYTAARMDLKTRAGGEVVLALSTTDGTLEIDAAASAVYVRLPDDALDEVPARDYVFDVELIRPDGVDAICAATSTISVLPEITTST